MTKFHLSILSIFFALSITAQCPVINGALINACAADGITEGINEFVFFTSPQPGAVSLYKFSYGSRNPPASQTPTGILAGVDASAKIGPGTIIVQPGNTLHEITSAAGQVPANSRVVFIPNNFDQVYDLTSLCINNELYVVYININSATTTASKWMAGGTMANAATTLRYLQLEYNGNACTGNVRTYDATLWPNPGNTPEAEGNSLAWTDQDSTLYLNNGCSAITTPVKLADFTVSRNGSSAILHWSTVNELNTKQFGIESGTDGKTFRSIGNVNAGNNSDLLQQYSFTDQQLRTGNNFYRLKIIDNDGSFSYSPVKKIYYSNQGGISLYPSATTGALFLEVNTNVREQAAIHIYDQQGRLLSRQTVQLANGFSKISLSVDALPAGAYRLQLISNQASFIKGFTRL